MVPELEIRLDPMLERAEPQFLEARDLRLGERLIREIGERRAAPQAQRLHEYAACRVCIAGGQRLAPVVDECLETFCVHPLRVHAQLVAR